MNNAPRKRYLLQGVIRWHYRMGLVAAFFVAALAISGILLNHNAHWNLPHRMIENEWLLSWYGLPVKAETGPTDGATPPGVSVDRLLLDIHTGRILGRFGPYLMDAAAILLLLMVITGVYSWAKRPKR